MDRQREWPGGRQRTTVLRRRVPHDGRHASLPAPVLAIHPGYRARPGPGALIDRYRRPPLLISSPGSQHTGNLLQSPAKPTLPRLHSGNRCRHHPGATLFSRPATSDATPVSCSSVRLQQEPGFGKVVEQNRPPAFPPSTLLRPFPSRSCQSAQPQRPR